MARWHRGCALVMVAVALAALTAANDARAAEPSASDRERARALLLDGRDKLESGDAESAVKAFQAAHAIMNVPTTGLDLVRGLMALGRLIEARTVALDVSRMPEEPKEPRAFTKARNQAEKLAEALAKRIPALVIEVNGPPAGKAMVTVDGAAVPAEALGLEWKVDPGEHTVEAKASGFQAERRTVQVDEGATLPVELTLSGSSSSRGPGDEPEGKTPAWAWASGGVGILALGVGVAFAIDYASVRSTVAADCPSGICDLTRYDDPAADALEARWNRDLGLAVGLGAVGLVGIGAAIYGIAAGQPSEPEDTALAPSPWFAPGAAGVTLGGAF